MKLRIVALVASCGLVLAAGSTAQETDRKGGGSMESKIQVWSVEKNALVTTDTVVKSDDEWRKLLTAKQYDVMRKQGTERAFTGAYWDLENRGVYRCVACGNDLFLSETKFDSGTGWPSFYDPVHPANIGTEQDRRLWNVRIEVHCNRCGAHLGHVFEDGPAPTGLRYCLNSAALDFMPMDAGTQ